MPGYLTMWKTVAIAFSDYTVLISLIVYHQKIARDDNNSTSKDDDVIPMDLILEIVVLSNVVKKPGRRDAH